MERLKAFLHRKLDGFTLDEYIIIVCCVVPFFFHSYCCLIAIACTLVYLLVKKRWKNIINEVPRSKWAIGFCLLTSLVAFVNGNYLGGVCAIGILLLLLFIFYYRTIINKRLLNYCWMLVVSYPYSVLPGH